MFVEVSMRLILSFRPAVFIFMVIYSACSYGSEKTYTVNTHIFKHSSLEPFIYRAVHEVSATSIISRVDMSFHSNINIEKKTETFALDHCLDLDERSPRNKALILTFRNIVKEPKASCVMNDFFDLNKLMKVIMSDPVYIRLTQHSDRKKMRDKDDYIFHSDFKYGAPNNPKKFKSGHKMFKANSHKNLASRLNRWFVYSSVESYIHAKHTMKFIDSSIYNDYLLGSNCSYAIMEVSILNPAEGTNNAGLLFYNFSISEALLIEIQSSPQCNTSPSVTLTPDTVGNGSNPDPENDKQVCRAGLSQLSI